MAGRSWKDALAGAIPQNMGREIDIFETQLELRRQGKIEEKLFAETRLRRGAYGQRYDNAQRHDGVDTQTLAFPRPDLTKGPQTIWDAPGMQRIKLPLGRINPEQLEAIAACAEEYSDAILHVTTRQDIQLHFVHIEDVPDLMRRLAAVGITTKEACGNSVRNVTACPYAGVCHTEPFDVGPYAHAMTYFLMGHEDTMDFGRKFKVAFSGCEQEACALVAFHDLGCIAKTKVVDGVEKRGFAFYVAGGLGSVPQQAKLFDEFVSEEEILPLAQAICRVFGRLGEKENRARARLKFLVKKLGEAEFFRLVREERQKLKPDPRWTSYLQTDMEIVAEAPIRPAAPLTAEALAAANAASPSFAAWRRSNVRPQRQAGYVVATVTAPLGDITSDQARTLADIGRRWSGDGMRATVDQNFALRWVPEGELPALHAELVAAGLAEAGAGEITDVTACPGTDTCKLGISSSRGLAGELRKRLTVLNGQLAPEARSLHIKASGCFNACGQHHVADMGFLGVSRNVNGRRVPHFQLVVGGQWENNAANFGLAIGVVPSKNVPLLVDDLTKKWLAERTEGESFRLWIQRAGKKAIRAMVEARNAVPAYDADRSFYSDWGDPREYTIGDMGVGECAGEVVPYALMQLAAAEREVFEASLLLEQGDTAAAASRARSAMLIAARGLVRQLHPDVGEDPAEIVAEVKTRLVETKLLWDPFAGAKFAQFLYRAVADGAAVTTHESAHQRIEEAQLFVDASHQCYERMVQATRPPAPPAETPAVAEAE
jgi:sulfite reductase (ferredoxin)